MTPEELKEKRKEYRKRYYQKHKESILQRNREYRNKNADKFKEYSKEYAKRYYQRNREKIIENKKEQYKQYYQRNREKRIEYGRGYFQQNREKIIEKTSEHNINRNNISRLSANNHRQLWDPAQEEILIKLYKRNTPHEEIATQLSRTIEAIRSRIKRLKKLGKL